MFAWREAIRNRPSKHKISVSSALHLGTQSLKMLQGIWLCRLEAFICTKADAEPGLNRTVPRALGSCRVTSFSVTGTYLPSRNYVHDALM